MIAYTTYICLDSKAVKKLITPDLRPLRALFFLFFLTAGRLSHAQTTPVDSLIQGVEAHPHTDSLRIHMMHRISYMLSESDVKKSFDYYERVSYLSDSLHFTYGKALANINLGILLSSSGNFESSTKAYLKAIDLAKESNARR